MLRKKLSDQKNMQQGRQADKNIYCLIAMRVRFNVFYEEYVYDNKMGLTFYNNFFTPKIRFFTPNFSLLSLHLFFTSNFFTPIF